MKNKTVECVKHSECNGCQMCKDICPVDAIDYRLDTTTGFWYPNINAEKCVNCGLCFNRCSQANPFRRVDSTNAVFNIPKVMAAWTLDKDIRIMSTSGGLFYEIAKTVIEQGGAVVACKYSEDYRSAEHAVATDMESLMPLCGSKYFQSDAQGVYKKVKELLDTYNKVFFVGTPCQVAALYSFLGKENEKLLTADFICNSISSPLAQSKYIDYLEDVHGGKLTYARSKDKRYGWTKFGSSAKFDNGKEYFAFMNDDLRCQSYHKGHLFIRESCEDCKYKISPRNSDITLGDFWGIKEDKRNPELEDGTSVVLINTKIGLDFMEYVKKNLGWYTEEYTNVTPGNPALYKNVVSNGNREKAFMALHNNRFDVVVNKYKDKESSRSKIKRFIKSIIHR